MDLYILKEDFTKDAVLDDFNSVIWTERYNDSGDIDLKLSANSPLKNKLVEGVYLATPGTKEVMLIDTVKEDKGVLNIIGRTLSDFLKQRMLRNVWQEKDSWAFASAPAGAIANLMVQKMCIAGGYITDGQLLTSGMGANEAIPNLSVVDPPAGSNYAPAIQYGNVFDGVKTVCDLDSLGFTLYPSSQVDGSGELLFKTYRGKDLTTSQTDNPIVIFEAALDSLVDITELRSISGYKNVVYVWPQGITSQSQIVAVYAPGAETLVGFARRTMMLSASDVNVADFDAGGLEQILIQKGRDALANNNYVRMLDGTLVPQLAYIYGVNYSLGDVIELRGTTTTRQAARITEYIRSQDSTGERSYPTLSVI